MLDSASHPPPRAYAAVGGGLYLLIFALGFALFAFPSVRANGVSAIQAIEASQAHLRVICAAELVLFSLDVPLAVILYVLLRDVDRNIALLAAFFRLSNAFFGSVSVLGRMGLLILLGSSLYRSAFNAQQLQTLGALFETLHENAQDIGLIFFGAHCILIGILIVRSKYFPSFIGLLLPVGGVAYMVNSFANIVAPAFSARIPFTVFLPGLIAEISLCLWLLLWGFGGRRSMQPRAAAH